MKSYQLFSFFYTWANKVLNTDLLYNIPIIQSHEDAPDPDGAYIAIAYMPQRLNKSNYAIHGDVDITTDKRTNVIQYDGFVEIWEVNSDGRYLSELINSIEREDIKNLWATNKVALWNAGEIIAIPSLAEKSWKRESMVELRIAWADSVEDTAGFIDDTNIIGVMPAQGRTGEHTIGE